MIKLRHQDFYSLQDWDRGTLESILETSLAFKKKKLNANLQGKKIASVYLNPSLRTRLSLEAAVSDMGGKLFSISEPELWHMSVEEGSPMYGSNIEHVKDAANTIGLYADALALRAFGSMENYDKDRLDPVFSAFRKYAKIPVINLGSQMYHPLQALADIQTLKEEFSELENKKITLIWSYNPKSLPMNSVNSVLLACSRFGMNITLACPPQFELDGEVLDKAHANITESRQGSLSFVSSLERATEDAKVVYALSWGSKNYYGKPEQEKLLRERLKDWNVDGKKMRATQEAFFMCALPVRRNLVATDDVIDGINSLVYRQAENLRYIQQSVLHLILNDTI